MKNWSPHRQIRLVVGVLSFVTGAQVLAQALTPERPRPPLPPGATEILTLPAQPRPPVTLASQIQRPAPVFTPMAADVLAWDADLKEYNAKIGEITNVFIFNLTNISPAEVVINTISSSCGCTVAKLPQQPWHLPPGTNGNIQVTANFQGKFGTVVKTVTVNSSAGSKVLTVKVNIPIPPPQTQIAGQMNRGANQQLALADRQAVFKGDCAKCHVEPTIGKMGKELYQAGCAICHDAEHRATMVPDLHAPKHPTSREYWHTWVTVGKAGTLMPAFAQEHGGPLTKDQVTSLVHYLTTDFPITNAAPVTVTVPTPAGL